MPKNKKPAGGRPAKNFDPRYAKKSSHRGQGGPAASRKNRWSDEERAGRSAASDISRGTRSGRQTSGGRDDRFGDDSRGRGFDRGGRDDRGGRPYGRDDRAGAGRDDRGGRSYGRDDRAGAGRNDRGGRAGGRDDRGAPAHGRDDRSGRSYGRDDRGSRSYDGDRRFRRDDDRQNAGRGARFDRDERRRDADRADRGFGARQGDRFHDDRGSRSFDGDRRSRDDRRAAGREFSDRGSRFDRDDRRRDAGRGHGSDRVGRFDGRSDDRFDRSSDRRFDRDADRRAPRDGRGPRRENTGERAWREHREQQQRPQRSSRQEERIDVVHEKLEAQAVEATDVDGVTFASLGLGDNIVRALAALGAETPFPIQASTAPSILDGRDVLARGRTGSGKTIAFGAPLVERILRAQKGVKREFGRAPVALILAPTRELALQIDRTVQPIARSVGLFTTQIYGGVPQARQVGALRKGVDIIIGTPGRIEDLHEQGKLDLSQVRTSILDEADHMCELGFLEPVQRILRLTADGGQKLLFSATLDREVASLVDEFLVDPAVYEVAGETQETGTIDHRVLVVEHRRKPEILEQLVAREGRTLVFTRTRAYAEMLAEQFAEAGVKAIALHGDLNQAKRTRNIEKFSKGKAQVLVATDVAARGIHVDDVDLVVQADAPDEYKTYMHRAGRTGRAGNEGRVVTLIPRGRRRRMEELLDRAEIDAPFEEAAPGDDLIDELAGAMTIEELSA